MRARWALLPFSLLAFAPTALSAQAVTGALEGRVLSADGQALEDAIVTVSGPFLQGARSLTTDAQGRFIFFALPPGAYAVELRRMGYRPTRLGDVAVRLGSTASVSEVRLEPTAVEVAAIEVSGERPLLDPLSTAAATTLDSSFFRKIPMARDFQRLAELAPSVMPGPTEATLAGTGTLTFAGSTEAENATYVDGINTTDVMWGAGSDVTLPFNFVREAQVLTGAYEAEYGRSLGGVINAVTNSGGNDFHVQAIGFFSNNDLRTTPRLGLGDSPIRTFGDWDVGASVSGPIQRDRLWYYVTYNPTFNFNRVAVPGLAVERGHRVTHNLAGKLTWRSGTGTDVTFTVLASPGGGRNYAGGLGSQFPVANVETVGEQSTFSNLSTAVELRRQFGRSLLTASVSYMTTTQVLKPLVAQATLAGLAKVTDYTTSSVSGSIGWDQDRTFRRTAVRLGLTHVAGAHTLKAGAEYEANWITWMLRLSYITVTTDTVWPYQWWSAENFMEGYNHVPTLYVQDSWAVTPHMRVNAGLRWEGEWLGGVTGAGPHIADQFAPRLGVVLQPGPTGRHKITASYGRFYQQVAATSPGYWYGTGWTRTVNYASNPLVHDLGGDTIGFQPQDATQAESHLRGESYDEFTAGYERLLSPVLKVGVRAIARSLNWSLDDTYQPSRIVFGNPGRGVLAYLPRAKRDYRALEVTLERSGRGPLTYLVSYVLSRVRGNTPGVWGQDVQANPSCGNCSPEFDNLDGPQNWSGPLPNDRTHLFKFAGSYRWSARATIGASGMLASGTPRTEQAASASGWPYVTYVVGRGNLGRTPWTWDLNLRVSYLLPMQGRARPQLVLDVFHVGSPRQAIWYYDQHYTTPKDSSGVWSNPDPSYGSVQNYQPPMSARLGMQIDF